MKFVEINEIIKLRIKDVTTEIIIEFWIIYISILK